MVSLLAPFFLLCFTFSIIVTLTISSIFLFILQCSTEESIIATKRPETGTSLGNGVKTISNVVLQHEKANNNIDTHEGLLFQVEEKGKINREEYKRTKGEEVR